MSNADEAPQAPVPPSSPGVASGLAQLGLGQKVLLGSSVLLLISSFLPWFHWSSPSVTVAGTKVSSGITVSANGWHHLGTLVWIVIILLLVAEGARLAGALPLDAARSTLLVVGLGGVALLFGVIDLIQWLSDGHLGFGFYVGVIGFIGLAYGLVEVVKSGNVMATVKAMQGNA